MRKISRFKRAFLNSIGIWYIVLGIIALIEVYYNGNFNQIFWFCYIGMILIGIGILSKNSSLILVELNILGISLILWSIDFLYQAATNVPLWGITDYLFRGDLIIPKIVSLQHLYTVPILLFTLSLLKIKHYNLWAISLLQALFIQIITLRYTLPQENINCVYRSCISFLPLTWHYQIIWSIGMFVIIFVTNKVIVSTALFRTQRRITSS